MPISSLTSRFFKIAQDSRHLPRSEPPAAEGGKKIALAPPARNNVKQVGDEADLPEDVEAATEAIKKAVTSENPADFRKALETYRSKVTFATLRIEGKTLEKYVKAKVPDKHKQIAYLGAIGLLLTLRFVGGPLGFLRPNGENAKPRW